MVFPLDKDDFGITDHFSRISVSKVSQIGTHSYADTPVILQKNNRFYKCFIQTQVNELMDVNFDGDIIDENHKKFKIYTLPVTHGNTIWQAKVVPTLEE